MDSPCNSVETRVLVLAPTEADRELSRHILADAGLDCHDCSDFSDLIRQMALGVGVVLLTEEEVSPGKVDVLVEKLEAQPHWSDLPIVLLSAQGEDSPLAVWALEQLGNVTVLEMPVRLTTLVSTLKSAIRARKRQYELRSQVELLSASESRWRQLLSLMPMAVYTCDADGRITFFNHQAAQLWGRSPQIGDEDERFCGSFRLWRMDGSLLSHHETPMAKAIREGDLSRNLRVNIERPDRTRITASVNIDPLHDDQGRRIGAINVFEDVSERVQVEEALKDANRRKDEFLAMLAHELRNPLAPIRTGMQVIQLCGDDRETALTTIAMMDRQVSQLVRLIDDLLDISRITRGRIQLRKEECNLGTVLSDAIESSRPLIEEASLEITVSTPRQSVELFADPTRLAQIVSNLLTNAAKYTERGGHIWLTAERNGQQLVVSVRDTGIGIQSENLSRIFEMFTQIDKTHRSHGGLGIGLSLVKALVEMHEGTIEAHSDGLGKGSEFIVRLPIVIDQTQERIPESSDDASRKGGGHRILVIDDNQAAAKTVSMILKYFGNEVRIASDGLEGVAAAEEFQPELILLDLGMPKLNGYDVARHIRQQSWGQEMVLAALTGWGQDEDRQRSKEAGFDHHFVKPVEAEALRRLIDELPTGVV